MQEQIYWPYDEVRMTAKAEAIEVATPWLTVLLHSPPELAHRTRLIADKIFLGKLSPPDLNEVSWIMKRLKQFPFFYLLPSQSNEFSDAHFILGKNLDFSSFAKAYSELLPESQLDLSFFKDTKGSTWDIEAALSFCQQTNGEFDPRSLFTVVRRFHYLTDVEKNQTGLLLAKLQKLRSEKQQYLLAARSLVRQNHYITEMCDSVLHAALPLAQSVLPQLEEFRDAERGHDLLLKRAIESMNSKPESIKVFNSTLCLMELFSAIAAKNFLAFSMAIDFFERTTFNEQDPFAEELQSGGATQAAKILNQHREINDQEEHENVALGFLSSMRSIDRDYATEAFYLAEMLTEVMLTLSKENLDWIEAQAL